MNILYDHQFFSTLNFSGISRYHHELLKYLVAQPDCNISIFMGFHINKFDFNALKQDTRHFFGMHRIGFPGSGRFFNLMNRVGLPLFSMLDRHHIYHQTYYSYFLPHFTGKRIVTIHDMIYFLFPHYFGTNDRIREAIKKSVQNAAGIIAVSENSKKDLMEILGVPEKKIRVTYEANSLTGIPSPENPIKCPYVLFVGQRFHWKNFIALLEVFARSQVLNENFHLVCFGGSEWTEPEKEIISCFSLQDRILRTSGSDDLLATYYAHASALVYPSLYEGFGLPVLEAMHYGCPVIASNRGSVPEIGGDAASYFDPADDDMLEHVLLTVLNSEGRRADLSRKGKERESRFSWKKCGKETHDFYKFVSQL